MTANAFILINAVSVGAAVVLGYLIGVGTTRRTQRIRVAKELLAWHRQFSIAARAGLVPVLETMTAMLAQVQHLTRQPRR